MLNYIVFIILWIKLLGVCLLCNLFKSFVLSANLRQVTPQTAKHKGSVSQVTKHYEMYSKQQYVEINIILHDEHFSKTWKPAKIIRNMEEGKETDVTMNGYATNTSS